MSVRNSAEFTATGQVVATNVSGSFAGFSIRETSGTAVAAVRLFSGSNTGGKVLAEIGLMAGDSKYVWVPLVERSSFQGGIYAVVVSGAVAGVVRYD